MAGTHGSLTLQADGSCTYVVDNTNTTIQGLRSSGNTLSQATGDVLLNDTDVDNVAYGETRTVLAIRTGAEAAADRR
ncbi:MAG: hypothetical protein IPN78_10360 [Candidatus Accumulibacter sp.]|nr:hypothetical protein [Candidatus Accumulibacter propinquus]